MQRAPSSGKTNRAFLTQNTKLILGISELSQSLGAILLGVNSNVDVFRTWPSTQGTLKKPFNLDFQPSCAEEGTKLQ